MKDTLREQIVHILYGDWISYESIKKGKVAETDTKDVDAILSLIEEEVNKRPYKLTHIAYIDDEFVGADGVEYKLVPVATLNSKGER